MLNDDVKKLNFKFDIAEIESAMWAALEMKRLHKHHNQLGLTHTPGSDDIWYDACGSLKYKFGENPFDADGNLVKIERNVRTDEFTEFNAQLSDSYLKHVYDTIRSEFNIGRARIMALPHKKCMSIHTDTQTRIHVPVVTNDKCRLMIDYTAHYLPADGHAYWTDTTKPHTAFNGNQNFLRYHLLFDLVE